MASLSAIVAAGLLLAQPIAEPTAAERAEVEAEGQRLWATDDFAAVAAHFEQAYARDPQPEYLYAQAKAEIRRGRCEQAVEVLDRLLASDPPEELIPAVDAELERCGAEPKPTPSPPPPAVIAATPEPAAQPEPASLEDTPRRRPVDALGVTLTSVGALLLSTGVPVAVVGGLRANDPPRGNNEDDYRRSIEGGRTLFGMGLGLGTVGAGLLTAGIVRLVRHKRGSRS